MVSINRVGAPLSAEKPFEAPQTLTAPAQTAEGVAKKELEVRKIAPGESLSAIWESEGKSRGLNWNQFKALNAHIFEHPKTDSGNHVRPGFEVLLPPARTTNAGPSNATAAASAPGWAPGQPGAGRGLVNPPLANAPKPEAGAGRGFVNPPLANELQPSGKPDPKLTAAAQALRTAGYEPTEANLKPDALAAELLKRSAGKTSIDYDFVNAAMGYAHASGSVAALNEAVGKSVAAKAAAETQPKPTATKAEDQPFHQLAKSAEEIGKDKGPKDNFLRAIIAQEATASTRKTAIDYLTEGVDRHRATTMEKLTEQTVRWGKDVGQSISDNPGKALAIAAGGAALVAAAPFAVAAAATWAAVAAGIGAAASPAVAGLVATTVSGVMGAAAVGAVAYGATNLVEAGDKLYRAKDLNGAERDAVLEGTMGDAIQGALTIAGGRQLLPKISAGAPSEVAALPPPGPPRPPAPARIGGPGGGTPPPAAVAAEPLQLTYQPAQPIVQPVVPKAEPVARGAPATKPPK